MSLIDLQQVRDSRAYEESKKFLLNSYELHESVLEKYLHPLSQPRTLKLNEIYERMLLSAANVGRNINTVKKYFGYSWGSNAHKIAWMALGVKLYDFEPTRVRKAFGEDLNNWEKVWELVGDESTQIPQTIIRFCKTTISAAKFLLQFQSADDFYDWIELFVRDTRARAALPMIIEREVFGYGFALACDFIKDLGYSEFPKPDTHLRDICIGIGLCSLDVDDYHVYKAVIRAAHNAQATPYAFDRIFYLIGSGDFFLDPTLSDRVVTAPRHKRMFIEQTRKRFEDECLL